MAPSRSIRLPSRVRSHSSGRTRGTRRTTTSVALLLVVSSCAVGSDAGSDDSADVSAADASSCLVSLHGKGGDGAPPSTNGDVTVLSPTGNDDGWGGRQWNYLDDDAYTAAVAIVADSIDEAGCDSVAINGFSNGGAFAAKLLCRGETFDDRLVGIVIDDPVTDRATAECERSPAVDATLYWTGALAATAPPGTDCGPIDWTCEGGVVVGVDDFAAAADLEVTTSPFAEHVAFADAPDPLVWLDEASG